VAKGAEWAPSRLPGFQARDTTIAANTKGVAGVQVIRKGVGDPVWATHDADIHFTFVMDGTFTLEGGDQPAQNLSAGDAFVIPPGMRTRYADPSDDLELLEVALPGIFASQS
jgi:quercetin dioxygenase-like cupin family protein